MRKDKQQFFEKKDSGFSLITVMVSVSFIAIMGLLVLYLSLNNFQMKHTDIKGKDSFYTAEQALEEIRPYVEEFCRTFGKDADEIMHSTFYMLTPNSKTPYKQLYTNN